MEEDYNGVIGIVFQRTKPLKFLLIHNKKTGNISFPAGGKSENETSSLQTLQREIYEETGLQPSDYKITKTPLIHEFTYNSKKTKRAGQKAKQPIYLIETSKININQKDPDTKIEGWHTYEETIQKLTFPNSKELFKKAIQYI